VIKVSHVDRLFYVVYWFRISTAVLIGPAYRQRLELLRLNLLEINNAIFEYMVSFSTIKTCSSLSVNSPCLSPCDTVFLKLVTKLGT